MALDMFIGWAGKSQKQGVAEAWGPSARQALHCF